MQKNRSSDYKRKFRTDRGLSRNDHRDDLQSYRKSFKKLPVRRHEENYSNCLRSNVARRLNEKKSFILCVRSYRFVRTFHRCMYHTCISVCHSNASGSKLWICINRTSDFVTNSIIYEIHTHTHISRKRNLSTTNDNKMSPKTHTILCTYF